MKRTRLPFSEAVLLKGLDARSAHADELAQPSTGELRLGNIFDAVTNNPEEALELKRRSDQAIATRQMIEDNGWTVAEAAEHLGLTKQQVIDLLNGDIVEAFNGG